MITKEELNLKQDGVFLVLLKLRKKILFDTGCNGVELLFNLKKLGYTPKDFGILFLSHQHWDHIGGLFEILEENKNLKSCSMSLYRRKSYFYI